MKTTLDLPDELVRRLKVHAVRERRTVKDLVARLLRRALATAPAASPPAERATIVVDAKTGLPLIKCESGAPLSRMTNDEINALMWQTQEDEDIERFTASV